MQLALVQGHAHATLKHRSLAGTTLLACQMLGGDDLPMGEPVLAVDKLGAGIGDRVILTSDGPGLRTLLGDENSPVRWWTMGIVDP
jgi:ethanolamine utilization protein EutN